MSRNILLYELRRLNVMHSSLFATSPSRASECELGSPRATRTVGWWILALIALVAVGTYINAVPNGFALDDLAIVYANPSVKHLEWTAIWSQNYWPAEEAPPDVLYRPLTIWSYLVNQTLAPGAAWTFHLTNVALHAVVCVMVALLAWRFFHRRSVAFLSGLLFAVHPIHSEVVANTVGRAELLAAIWSLAAMLVLLPQGDIMTMPAKPRALWHGWLVAACFLLAMLCKETPAALVGAIVIYDLWRWSHWSKDLRPRFWRFVGSQTWRYYLPGMTAFGVYLAMRIHATGLFAQIGGIHPVVNLLILATPLERLLTPFMLLAKYLGLMAWPVTLSADYSAPSIMPSGNPLNPGVAAGLLIVSLAVLLAVRYRRQAPRIVLLAGLFVCSYALVANFLRIGTIFGERLFYWPSVFVTIAAAVAMMAAWRHFSTMSAARVWQTAAVSVLTLAVVAMGYRTVIRNTDWQDNIPLAIATARDNPNSAKACSWAGMVLVTNTDDRKMNDFGEVLLNRSIELYPEYGQSYFELAKYCGRQHRFAESVIYLTHAARWSGGTREMRISLKGVAEDLKKRPVETYLPALHENLKNHPEDPSAYMAMGMALRAQNRLDEAHEMFFQALQRGKAFDEAGMEMGLLLQQQGRLAEAIDMVRKYVMRIHMTLEGRCTLAGMLMEEDGGHNPHALAEAGMNLDKAQAMSPGNSRVRELREQLKRLSAAVVSAAAIQANRPQSMHLAGGGV